MPERTPPVQSLARHGLLLASAAAARLRAGPRDAAASAPHILVLRPDHVGDVLLSTPALTALRRAFPRARITALVGPWSASVLAVHPAIDDVLVYAFPGFSRAPSVPHWMAYRRLLELANRMRRWRVDVAINLRPDFWWGAGALALAGIPIRVGFDIAPGMHALTHREPFPAMPEHAARLALHLVRRTARCVGSAFEPTPPFDALQWPLTFPISSDSRQWAASWLARQQFTASRSPLFLHPGAGAAVKLWTAQQWALTLTTLAQDTGAPVLIGGRPAEAALVREVASLLPPSVEVATCLEDIPLGHYAALISRSRLALGVDSGPLHLAVAVGTPSVRLAGPADALVYGPWGSPDLHAVVSSGLVCAPCGRLDYPNDQLPLHPCVRLITPSTVIEAAHHVLANAALARVAPDLDLAGAIGRTLS